MDGVSEQGSPKYDGIFIGTVVYNDDPTKTDRIKVTIPQLFQGAPETLPWVGKCMSASFPDARDGTFGTFQLIPQLGTQVIVFFQDGNPHYPMYSSYPHQKDERVAEALVHYGKVYGFKDPAGNLIKVDTTPGSVTMTLTHKSGTTITINDDGSITSFSAGDWTHTGGDWIVNGISAMHHIHGGVDPGGGVTDEPVP
jgi:phage baseplate assembly protein gpV